MTDYDRNIEAVKREMSDLRTRLERMTDIAADQKRILDLCPMGLPDGTGIMTAEAWIKWAKRRLGYVE